MNMHGLRIDLREHQMLPYAWFILFSHVRGLVSLYIEIRDLMIGKHLEQLRPDARLRAGGQAL